MLRVFLCIQPVGTYESLLAALEISSDSIELPLTVVPVHLASYDCGLDREILAKVKSQQFIIVRRIYNSDVSVLTWPKFCPRSSTP